MKSSHFNKYLTILTNSFPYIDSYYIIFMTIIFCVEHIKEINISKIKINYETIKKCLISIINI